MNPEERLPGALHTVLDAARPSPELEDRIVDDPGRGTLERLFGLKRSLVEIRHVQLFDAFRHIAS